MNSVAKIAIVGLGPRGAVMLERVITWLQHNNMNNQGFSIILFDSNSLAGSLVYKTKSDNLLLNTMCSQVTLYSGETTKEFGPTFTGPSLYEYYKDTMEIESFDYLPRKLFYLYLKNFINQQLERLKVLNVEFKLIIQEITDLKKHDDYLKLISHTNEEFYAEKVILCTGHGTSKLLSHKNNKKISKILNPDDLKQLIPPKEKVIIKGMGLVTFDIISELTEGLGGRFINKSGYGLKYIASGLEPKIYVYSRTGLPLSGKGYKDTVTLPYNPKFFTVDNITNIINSKANLDFDRDFLPLLIDELTYKYEEIEGSKTFNADKFFYPHKYIAKDNFQLFYKNTIYYILEDIKACKEGVFLNGKKAASEALRDLRDNLRLCVDQKKLLPQSHKRFLEHWNPIFNKICVGPPHFRIEQFLALIKAGVISLDIAYNPQTLACENTFFAEYCGEVKRIEANYFIDASIPDVEYVVGSSKLWLNLKNKINLFHNGEYRTGGIDIDEYSRIKSASGNIFHDGLYAFGIPTEGNKYFTYVLPRPDVPSTFLKDSNLIANHIFKSF